MLLIQKEFHPSINLFSLPLIHCMSRLVGNQFQLTSGKRANPTYISLDCGRKPEHLKGSHAHKGKTSKLHRNSLD